MTTEQRITTFNEENRPFYIVDLESGRYSLCLPLDLLGDEAPSMRMQERSEMNR